MQTVGALPLSVLHCIYQIVKEDIHPLTYLVRPRELILRSMQDWNVIHSAIKVLEERGFVVTKQVGTLQISLTSKGLEYCQLNHI